jgi:uncharacterized caspase-like protein
MRHSHAIAGRLVAAFFAVAGGVAALAFPGEAEERPPLRGVALVIGVGDYAALAALPNAERDARAVEQLLSNLNFETDVATATDARRLRRDLDRFVEDAAGADVAVLYYAGHGIEAGGENWLVPANASTAALDSAGESLVALSAIVARLEQTTPLTIVLLDACRDSPFPPGSVLKTAANAPAMPIAAAGLGETRGAASLAAAGIDSFGMVLGFAAAPGKAALDGEPGSNSPYAAALLRHLSAMTGEEFGTVMRMVAEEVYLKTGGRQRPWVNESLRRFLFFGGAPPATPGEEGAILNERRTLLLTISALPEFSREQVERVAGGGGVPMDAVYGMLKALGADAPVDPADLEKLLAAKTEELKAFLAERRVIEQPDPELARLSGLTDRAVAEGAIGTARSLRAEVDRRIEELSAVLRSEEENIRQRRIEFAAEFTRSAEVSALAFEHREAAAYYAKAYAEVERWDDELAWDYKASQVEALTRGGQVRGDSAALEEALAAADDLVAASLRFDDGRQRWAQSLADRGAALLLLGSREPGQDRLLGAVKALEEAVAALSPDTNLLDWVEARRTLGFAYFRLGERESGTAKLEKAAAIHRETLKGGLAEREPAAAATLQAELGIVLTRIGERTGGVPVLQSAVDALESSLAHKSKEEEPYDWAMANNNLGIALWRLGEFEGGTSRIHEAVRRLDAALAVITMERGPGSWATLTMNRASALAMIGNREQNTALTTQAVADYRSVLKIHTPDRNATEWLIAVNNLGYALFQLGIQEFSADRLREAIDALRLGTTDQSRRSVPTTWALIQHNIGLAYLAIAQIEGGTAPVREATAAIDLALGVRDRNATPVEWGQSMMGRGLSRAMLGNLTRDRDLILAGRADVLEAMAQLRSLGFVAHEAMMAAVLNEILAMLDSFPADRRAE